LTVQSYLQFQFKTEISKLTKAIPLQELHALTQSLIEMSASRQLLSSRETNALVHELEIATKIDTIRDILARGIEFQTARLTKLYYRPYINENDPALDATFQEMVRTSLITEWDQVLQLIQI
jgi:hypothetical protein